MKSEPVGELCDFISGLWKGDKPPFVRVNVYRNTNFTKDGTLDDSDVAELDVEARQYAKRKLQYGDIILEKSGGGPKQPVGRVALFDKRSGEYSLSNFTSALRIRDPKKLDFLYLHRFLFWQHLAGVTETMQKRSTGIRNLSGDEYKAIEVPLPPLPEQRRIVGILDEAFAGIATAKANAEKNLRNTRELFESELQAIFTRGGEGWKERQLSDVAAFKNGLNFSQSSKGQYVRVVGVGDFQRNYDVPMNELQSVTIDDTLGEAYQIREGDLLTVRSNGSKDLVGRCMLVPTTDEVISYSGFVIRIRCDKSTIVPRFLLHFMKSSATRERLTRDGGGANISNINQGKLSALTLMVPPLETQQTIVEKLDRLVDETQRLESLYQQKLDALDALKKSLLHQAFTGHLTAGDHAIEIAPAPIPFPVAIPNITITDLHAGILAMACEQHDIAGKIDEFTHVKAEKFAHMVEARLGIELGRKPVKDAAGPNDFNHLKKVEHRARMANFFNFKQVAGGAYRVQKLRGFDRLIEKTRAALGGRVSEVEKLLQWMLPMNVRQAEIVATVYAAWNNLLLDGTQPTDEQIVYESRENWHPDKLKIERWRFVEAVTWLKKEGVVPEGRGKRVPKKGK